MIEAKLRGSPRYGYMYILGIGVSSYNNKRVIR
jgi:hypothetical protein